METVSNTYDLYSDMRERTKGEIYIGVVGPVRTGKSTFIKRFMEEMVLPNMEDENAKQRATDELPQSAAGKTITTTEPKFVPNEAARIVLNDDIAVSVRLVDCVGYMVEGAAGHLEENAERMVKTPWFEEEIPFTKAAEIGTDKVMNDHSTFGIVVICDSTIGELPRNAYVSAEEKTILTLKKLQKPFLVLVNSRRPFGEEAVNLCRETIDKYQVTALPMDCEQMRSEDVYRLFEKMLESFPIDSIDFYVPKWLELLPDENELKYNLVDEIKTLMPAYTTIADVLQKSISIDSTYLKECIVGNINMASGKIDVRLIPCERYYYDLLTKLVGENISDESDLLEKLAELSAMKQEYVKVKDAVNTVRLKGYGVVTPKREEITLEKPELIKHGNKYGVKIKATSPSIHMIRANIETEIAPIVGTKEQAEDLITYINKSGETEDCWDTNVFGKTVGQLVNDGITTKVALIGEESQLKLQDTMQKVVNDNSGGMVCIIL